MIHSLRQPLCGLRLRIRTDDHGVRDLGHLIRWHSHALGVLLHRFDARRLIDADRAQRAVLVLEDVGPDPREIVRELGLPDLLRPCADLLELLGRRPCVLSSNRVQVHLPNPFHSWAAMPLAVRSPRRLLRPWPGAHQHRSLLQIKRVAPDGAPSHHRSALAYAPLASPPPWRKSRSRTRS